MRTRFVTEAVVVESRPMTEFQMKALEKFVVASHDGTEFAKKAILFLLRHSENLTKSVSLSAFGPLADEMQDGAHDMNSCNGTTRIDLFFHGMGTEFGLSHHCGAFVGKGIFNNKAQGGRTIWISPFWYDEEAEHFAEDTKIICQVAFPDRG